jgi:hypothetical protein
VAFEHWEKYAKGFLKLCGCPGWPRHRSLVKIGPDRSHKRLSDHEPVLGLLSLTLTMPFGHV